MVAAEPALNTTDPGDPDDRRPTVHPGHTVEMKGDTGCGSSGPPTERHPELLCAGLGSHDIVCTVARLARRVPPRSQRPGSPPTPASMALTCVLQSLGRADRCARTCWLGGRLVLTNFLAPAASWRDLCHLHPILLSASPAPSQGGGTLVWVHSWPRQSSGARSPAAWPPSSGGSWALGPREQVPWPHAAGCLGVGL